MTILLIFCKAGAKENIELVFIIDSATSMSDNIYYVRNNIYDITNNIGGIGNFQLSLYTFNENIYEIGRGLQPSELYNAVSSLNTSGTGHNGLDAINYVIDNYNFNESSKRYIVLIGDSKISSQSNLSDSEVVGKLKNNRIILYTIGEEENDIKNQFSSMSEETGGEWTNINSYNYDILTRIKESAEQSPLIIATDLFEDCKYVTNELIPHSAFEVSDPNNDTLEVKWYINAETQPRGDTRVTNTIIPKKLSIGAIDVSMLDEGWHILKVVASDSTNIDSISKQFYVDRTKPQIDSRLHMSTANSLNIGIYGTDNNALSNKPYRFTLGDRSSGWIKDSSFTFSDLSSYTKYDVELEARDKSGNTSVISEKFKTRAEIPGIKSIVSKEYTATINIEDNNPSGIKYKIYIKESKVISYEQLMRGEPNYIKYYVNQEGYILKDNIELFRRESENYTFDEIRPEGDRYIDVLGSEEDNYIDLLRVAAFKQMSEEWINIEDKKIEVKGLSPLKKYEIYIYAGRHNDSEYYKKKFVTQGAAPQLSFEISQRSNEVSWISNNNTNIIGYKLKINDSQEISLDSNQNSYIHSGLVPESFYTYQIAIQTSDGIGDYGPKMTIKTLPEAPDTPTIPEYSLDANSVYLYWADVIGADYYEIKKDDQVLKVNSNSFLFQDLELDTIYKFQVRATNEGGSSQWTSALNVTTLPKAPEVPIIGVESKSNTYINLYWNTIEEADGYEVKIDGIITRVGLNNQYRHAELKSSTKYNYQIRSFNRRGYSEWSSNLEVETNPNIPAVPTNIVAVSTQNSINITWSKMNYVDFYEIEIDDGSIRRVNTECYEYNSLEVDGIHTFRIRAANITGKSKWSSIVKGDLINEEAKEYSATNIIALVTEDTITLSWDSVDADMRYTIEVDGTTIDLNNTTNYEHRGLNPNEFHTYNIYVIDKEGNKNTCANLALSTLPNPPNAPEGLRGDAFINSIELRWDGIEGATAYDIEIDGDTVVTTNDIKYENTGLESGSSHTYRLRAKNITGVTGWSPSFTLATLNPAYTVDITEDETFTFTIVGQNVQDFQGSYLNFTYDASQVEIEDLYEGTLIEDVLKDGVIDKTKLAVEGTAGKLKIRFNESIVPGTSWSGEIMTIRFKAKTTGTTNINLVVEEE